MSTHTTVGVDKDPRVEHLRDTIRKQEKENLHRGPGVRGDEMRITSAMSAAVVEPFWVSPKELLWSRLGRNLMGKVKNADMMYVNLGMSAILFGVLYLQGYGPQYAILQTAVSLVEQVTMNQHEDFMHSNSDRSW